MPSAYYDPWSAATPQADVPSDDTPAWSDYAKQVGVGAEGLLSGIRSGAGFVADTLGSSPEAGEHQAILAQQSREQAAALQASMTPAGQAAATGPLLEHPFRGALMRGAEMAPALAATILPSGWVGGLLEGTAAAGAGAAATAAGTNAAITAGSYLDSLHAHIDNTPDADLRKQSPYYDELRNDMPEQQARDMYVDRLGQTDARLAIVALGGAVGGGFGLAGRVARGAGVGPMLGRAAAGAGEAGGAAGVQAGLSNVETQGALKEAGQQGDFDAGAWASDVLSNMGVGAAFGGLHGLTSGTSAQPHGQPGTYGHGSDQNYLKPEATPGATPGGKTTPTVETIDPKGPDEAQTAALAAKNPPPPKPVPPPPAVTTPADAQGSPVAAKSEPPATPVPPGAPRPPTGEPAAPTGEVAAAPEASPAQGAADQPLPTAPQTTQPAMTKLTNGEVPAVVFKPGEQVPPLPQGQYGQYRSNDGSIYYFDKEQVTRARLQSAIRDNTVGRYLGLTDVSKDEALSRVAAGENPAAIVERTPAGTEVKAAAGTDQTAPGQVQQMQAAATPGNTVGVETPARVIAERAAAQGPAPAELLPPSPPEAPAPQAPAPAGPRVLPDVTPEGIKAAQVNAQQEAAQRAAAAVQAQKADLKAQRAEAPVGAKRSTAEMENRQNVNDTAQQVVESHPPMPAEAGYGKGVDADKSAKEAIRFRAKTMADALKERGVTLPKVDKTSTDADANWNAHVLFLRKAEALAKKKYPTKSDYEGFITNDLLARAGEHELIRQSDRAENDAKFRKAKAPEEAPSEAPSHPTEEARHPDDVTPESTGEPAVEGRPEQEEEPAQENVRERQRRAEPAAPADKYARMAASRGGEEAPAVAGAARAPVVVATKRRQFAGMKPTTGEVRVSPKVVASSVDSSWEIPARNGEQETSLPVTASGKMRDLLGGLTTGRSLTREIEPVLARKLTAAIGDMDVHMVPQHAIDSVFSDKRPGAVRGFYDPNEKHIVLSDSIAPEHEAWVVMHEGLHGALHQKIETDPTAKAELRSLMNEFEAANPTPAGKKRAYALTNEHEFLSEVLANPRIRDIALYTPISRPLANRLGIFGKAANLWDGILQFARKALGIDPKYTSALDGVMRVAGRLGLDEHAGVAEPSVPTAEGLYAHLAPIDIQNSGDTVERQGTLLSKVGDQINALSRERGSALSEAWHQYAPKFLSNDQLRQNVEHLWGALNESNPVRRLVDGVEKANVYMKKLLVPATKLGAALSRARVKYEGDGGWDNFVDLMHNSTLYGVHPDEALGQGRNSHLALAAGHKGDEAKGNYANWQARAKHAELSKQYQALPQELQELYQRARDFYTTDRNGRVREAVGSILDSTPEAPTHATRAEIADRVHEGNMTDEDEEWLNRQVADSDGNRTPLGTALKRAQDVKKLKGPYFPLKRRGDYIVRAEHDVATPAGATREGNDFIFDSRQAAHDFARTTDLPATVGKAYYDPETGERLKNYEEGISTAGTPDEKYRVSVEPSHVEFARTERQANEIRQALIDRGMKNVKNVDKLQNNPNVENALHSRQLAALTNAIENNKGMSAEDKIRTVEALREASIGLQQGNRIEQTYLHRRGVSGASKDVVTNLSEYAHASAAYRSRAHFRNEIDGAMKDMRTGIGDDENTVDRRRALQEYEQRLKGFGAAEYSGRLAPFWQKLMTLSFLKRMASTAHLALHMMHPIMTSMPVVAGKMGEADTYRAFMQAYKDMGALGALGEAGKGFMRVAKGGEATNFGDYFRKSLSGVTDSGELGKMFDALEQTGHLHPDAGFDVSRYAEEGSSFDRGLRRVDETFRELTSGTESVNRYVTAIAAYRLARRKGMSDVEATRYAKDTIANTQGLYSATNAAPIFRNPTTRPFLQFKQYPAMAMHLMGKLVYQAFKGEDPETRQAALRGFAGMMGTAATLTGFSGLPNDVQKAVATLGNALGVTPSYEELEDDLRRAIAHQFGPELAQLAMGGILSMGPLGASVGHRAGFANMLAFGEPRSDQPNDIKAWAYDTLGGAPASMIGDAAHGTYALLHGDLGEAASGLIPAKQIDDMIKAGKLYEQGKVTPKGKTWLPPVGLGAATMQALGFVPAGVQNAGTARALAGKYSQEQRDQAKPKVGPKGRQILGIQANRKNTPMLREMAETYGVDQ